MQSLTYLHICRIGIKKHSPLSKYECRYTFLDMVVFTIMAFAC